MSVHGNEALARGIKCKLYIAVSWLCEVLHLCLWLLSVTEIKLRYWSLTCIPILWTSAKCYVLKYLVNTRVWQCTWQICMSFETTFGHCFALHLWRSWCGVVWCIGKQLKTLLCRWYIMSVHGDATPARDIKCKLYIAVSWLCAVLHLCLWLLSVTERKLRYWSLTCFPVLRTSAKCYVLKYLVNTRVTMHMATLYVVWDYIWTLFCITSVEIMMWCGVVYW
jgi:hypothetical protein